MAKCLSYFIITVITYFGKQLKGERIYFCLQFQSDVIAEMVACREGMMAGSGAGHISGSREVWLGFKASRPRPSDSLFLLASTTLRFHSFSKQYHKMWTKYSNIQVSDRVGGALLTFKTHWQEKVRVIFHKLGTTVIISVHSAFASLC